MRRDLYNRRLDEFSTAGREGAPAAEPVAGVAEHRLTQTVLQDPTPEPEKPA